MSVPSALLLCMAPTQVPLPLVPRALGAASCVPAAGSVFNLAVSRGKWLIQLGSFPARN